MIDDSKKMNPHPNSCEHAKKGLCMACKKGFVPSLTEEDKKSLSQIKNDWDRLVEMDRVLEEKRSRFEQTEAQKKGGK